LSSENHSKTIKLKPFTPYCRIIIAHLSTLENSCEQSLEELTIRRKNETMLPEVAMPRPRQRSEEMAPSGQ
jgi:hypothetical protein